MEDHTFSDLALRVAELKEHGHESDMIVVQAPGGRMTDIFIGKKNDLFTIDFTNHPLFGFLKYRRFKRFCAEENLSTTKETWGSNKVIRAFHQNNEYALTKCIQKYFQFVHNLKPGHPIHIRCMGWSAPNKLNQPGTPQSGAPV